MESKIKTILVLWDFTVKSEYAFAHAVNLSITTGDEIALLHVAKSENEFETLQKKLEDIAEKLNETHKIKPKSCCAKRKYLQNHK